MTTPTLFKEYIWQVNTIYQARNITLNDINKKWLKTKMSGGVELARSTFNRHKVAIEDGKTFNLCNMVASHALNVEKEETLPESDIKRLLSIPMEY